MTARSPSCARRISADAEARTRWLVASLWARAGVGILGGAPKCCKSWLALEMATAVASGVPAPEPVALALAGEDKVHLAVVTTPDGHDGAPTADHDGRSGVSLDQAVLDALATAPLPRADLRARLRVRNERLGETLTRLAEGGAVGRVGDCWAIPNSDSHLP